MELLNNALRLARKAGFEVRFDTPDGSGGSVCEIHGRPAIFLDLSSTPLEQLQVVVQALRARRGPEA